jgi:hypothetical protein
MIYQVLIKAVRAIDGPAAGEIVAAQQLSSENAIRAMSAVWNALAVEGMLPELKVGDAWVFVVGIKE